MFLVNLINKIVELGQPSELTINERKYTSKNIVPVHEPSPKALAIGTLTGFDDYLSANVDKLSSEGLIIHIEDFLTVSLRSKLKDPWLDRDLIIQAKNDAPKFSFGQFMDVESFIIRMQSMFVPCEQVDSILKIVGNVSDSVVRQFADDGVTQQATIKAGVSRVENVAIPNHVTLAPYRTFLEIEQPASKFVFRMHTGEKAPTCALFEADGGTWKNEAVLKIKEWLRERTNGIAIIA